MKILFDINHPHQVHFFKNAIWNLQKRGHEILTTASDKDLSLYLLNVYGFEPIESGKNMHGLVSKACNLPLKDYKLLKIARDFSPDILVSTAPYLPHVSRVIKKPHISFSDTENSKLTHRLTLPFTKVICTPSCFEKDLGSKQIRYEGYQELSYLHPNHFKPDPGVLDEIGLNKKDKFIILRFVSWGASHDIGDKGFTDTIDVVESLKQYGKILITSEKKLPKEIEKYKITIPPEKIHDLLYFTELYIGESATMASESAVLGTPAILVSTSRRGYTNEEENKYGLAYNFSDPKEGQRQALEKAFELLKNENTKEEWGEKRKRMLDEKIDVAKFMTEFIENYPESFYEYNKLV